LPPLAPFSRASSSVVTRCYSFVFPRCEHTLAQLNDFFGLVEQMQAVDTKGIEPLAHPIEQIEDVALRLREDAVTEIVQRDEFQRPAPAVQDGLYLVPKVIE
jgi:aspartyl-tRNA(Asn)/glutamyl-tRNA(Gln) amidotransferase subunit C